MKAMMIVQYGGPEALELVDLPVPAPGPGEVTIDVTHAAVGLVDTLIRRGAFADSDVPMKPPFIPGLEVAGTVREVGEGVTTLQPGDRVATLSVLNNGGYAEVMLAPAALTIALPPGVDGAQAVAALPNATTAHLALTHAATIRPGGKVLVLGATGALASVFPHIARRLGAQEVAGAVRSIDRIAEAEALGYDRVVLAGELAAALSGDTFDVIVDPVGGAVRTVAVGLLAHMGRLIAVGSADSHTDGVVDTDELWLNNRGVVGFNVGLFLTQSPEGAAKAAAEALAVIAEGGIRLRVTTYSLENAAEAHARMDAGSVSGRMVLTI